VSEKVFMATLPTCDTCPPDKPTEAAYDGKTKQGPWAYMCEPCFAEMGVGLGTGRGQRLVLRGG
jgi:hypothetical protein